MLTRMKLHRPHRCIPDQPKTDISEHPWITSGESSQDRDEQLKQDQGRSDFFHDTTAAIFAVYGRRIPTFVPRRPYVITARSTTSMARYLGM
jgi:hypothetical protein